MTDKAQQHPDDDLDEDEFTPCDLCDGHDACADFGCAFELGLGRMVKRDNPLDDYFKKS